MVLPSPATSKSMMSEPGRMTLSSSVGVRLLLPLRCAGISGNGRSDDKGAQNERQGDGHVQSTGEPFSFVHSVNSSCFYLLAPLAGASTALIARVPVCKPLRRTCPKARLVIGPALSSAPGAGRERLPPGPLSAGAAHARAGLHCCPLGSSRSLVASLRFTPGRCHLMDNGAGDEERRGREALASGFTQ